MTFAELIGEEIYDEFDREGQSRLSHYVSQTPNKPKRKGSRHDSPPIGPDANPTALAGPTQPSSPPQSPALSFSSEPPISRTTSLGPSLNALMLQKKTRATESSHHKVGKQSQQKIVKGIDEVDRNEDPEDTQRDEEGDQVDIHGTGG